MHPVTRIALYIVLASGTAAAVVEGCSSDAETGGTNSAGSLSSGSTSTETSTGGATASGGTGASASGGATAAGGASGTGTSTGGTSYVTSSGSGGPCVQAACEGHIYQCGDCIDNDGDGLVDSQDPDCLGPCDNTENSYYGGIPGQAGPSCTVDCYFDQDSGSGNDQCYWNHKCDPHETAPNYYPEHQVGSMCSYNANANTPGTGETCAQLYQMQSQQCLNFCGPLTPNGCDCFGCCNLPSGSANWVWLGSEINGTGSCTLNDVNDPSKCQPCEPVAACLNTCEHCELCIGKNTLPPDCFPDAGTTTTTTTTSGAGGASSSSSGTGGATGQCAAGVQPCGLPGELPCPSGQYCITGCCINIPN